jgi:hypothetical protein
MAQAASQPSGGHVMEPVVKVTMRDHVGTVMMDRLCAAFFEKRKLNFKGR